MNLCGVLRSQSLLFLVVLLNVLVSGAVGQEAKKAVPAEQTSFGSEEEQFEHPVPLSKAARIAIASEQSVADVLKDEGLSADNLPDDWFTASEVHLSGSADPDLVVMGAHFGRGAYTAAFWVLRKLQDGYSVVFRTDTHSLELQNKKTNGLCNILTGLGTLRGIYTDEYAFDGKTYKIVKRTSEPNGYTSNVNVDSYKNRKGFVQLRGQNQEKLLAEARNWIWTQWQSRATAYVRLSTQDDDGEEHDCSFFIEKGSEDGEMQITLKIHEIVWDQDSPAGPRYMITQDDIFVAVDLQRIEPPGGDGDESARVYSLKEEVSAWKYRLRFLDYEKDMVRIL
jgi:hypothetical protein